jgi:serine kinase of HPr protein (carbohydrate metabolism regulator)
MRILSCIDTESNIAYCCYEDAEPLLMYEISGPLRAILSTILNRKGMQLIHASAIGTSRGSLVFAGPPGAGKSTLAILCLQDGLSYQSDDLCVLTTDTRPRSLSVYNIAKLREDSLSRFESLHPILSHFQEDEEKKAYFYVHQHFPSQVLKEAPVRALILPRINGEPASRIERATPVQAMRAVISWTVKEIPKSDSLGDKIMLQAVARLPAHHLHLGRDDRQTLALIRSVLDDC